MFYDAKARTTKSLRGSSLSTPPGDFLSESRVDTKPKTDPKTSPSPIASAVTRTIATFLSTYGSVENCKPAGSLVGSVMGKYASNADVGQHCSATAGVHTVYKANRETILVVLGIFIVL